MTGVKNAIFSTMDASPTLIVHEAMNEYVVERDGFDGVVQVVHLCCLAPRVLNLLSVK